jgi:hypothetical protein
MKLLFGLLFLAAALGVWKLSVPKDGKPRSFVNTAVEVPIVLAILGALAVGVVLSIGGFWDLMAVKPSAGPGG